MQGVGAHGQRLALLIALVMAVLAEYHCQLLWRRSGGRVGKRKRAQSRPQASCGTPLFPSPFLGFSFLLGSSEREKGERWAGTRRGRGRVEVGHVFRCRAEAGHRREELGIQGRELSAQALAGSADSEPRSAPNRGR